MTGDTNYKADIPFHDPAHAKVVRSTVPHEYVEAVDIDDVLKMPGVIDVVLPEEVPGKPTIGTIHPDQPTLCGERVRYLGDAVAIVVAENEVTAQRAAGATGVDTTGSRTLSPRTKSSRPTQS